LSTTLLAKQHILAFAPTNQLKEAIFMDLAELNIVGKAGGIGQFAPPQSYELVGRQFEFAMDNGFDYFLRFIDKDTLEWHYGDGPPQQARQYLCAKGDDTTFLLSYELDSDHKSNHTWVIDLENMLVTQILSVKGEHPKYEYLIVPRYEFGAIKQDGVELKPYPRHGYTSDMVGNILQWNYGQMETVHVYYCTNFYRITYPPDRAASQVFNTALAKLPSSDEPTAYIKIKEGMYLFSLTESNMEKIIGAGMRFRSNTMCLLQNYKRVNLVGRTFGTKLVDDTFQPLHITFGAVGKVIKPTEEYILKMMTDPNPYLI
jgi:hypothetical protein